MKNRKVVSVIQTLRQYLPELKTKYSLQSLGVFGSYSRGEQRADSDIDIVYETLPDTFLNLHSYLNLQKELNQLTHCKVDLVNKRKMNEVVWQKAKNDVVYV